MFSNKEALERIEQAHGAKIEKMFWIAGSLESSDLTDLISLCSTCHENHHTTNN